MKKFKTLAELKKWLEDYRNRSQESNDLLKENNEELKEQYDNLCKEESDIDPMTLINTVKHPSSKKPNIRITNDVLTNLKIDINKVQDVNSFIENM